MTGNLLTSIHNQEMHKRQAQRSVAKIRTSPSVMIRSFFFPFLSQCTPVSLHFRLFLRISTSVKHSLVLSHSPWDFVFPVKVNVQDPKIRAGSVAFLKSVVKTASSLSERCTLANYAGRTRKDPGECFGNYGRSLRAGA
ncbi:uncharacterized protein [Physcomitrium patens]|uniref:uncharacterized protein isoform X4 n=1 Tax=Physcomitrium patens TaxID=3218 RepID=UPI003CCC9A73